MTTQPGRVALTLGGALKAQWVVRGGLFLGDAMSEHTRVWQYTSADYEADGMQKGERWSQMSAAADFHHLTLQKMGLNWTTNDYMWV